MQLNPLYKKLLFAFFTIIGLGIVGCSFLYFKNKAHQNEAPESIAVSHMTSCDEGEIVSVLSSRIQSDLRKKTDLELQTQMIDAGHSYDTVRLDHIFNSLKVSVENIRAQDQTSSDGTLACVVSVRVKPFADVFVDANKSLRASGASSSDCTDGCEEVTDQTLERQAIDSSFDYDSQSVVANNIRYTLQKDSDGQVVMTYTESEPLIQFMKNAIVAALDLPNVLANNAQMQLDQDAQNVETNQKLELVQQSMNLRLKEVNAENMKANDQLNTIWQRAGVTVTQSLLEQQRDWLKKRDVDCQILAERSWYDLKDEEKPNYDLEHGSWNQSMTTTDKEIRRVICITKRTSDRIAPLTQEITAIQDRLAAAQTVPAKP